MVLLPIAFNTILWLTRDAIGASWQRFFVVWLGWLDLPGRVTTSELHLAGGLLLRLPVVQVPAGIPALGMWLATLAASTAVVVASIVIPAWHAPLRYLLRLAAIVQISSLICFAVSPASFPYTVKTHVSDGLLLTMLLLTVVPWLHTLTYYIFEFSFIQKTALTAMTLAYFIAFAPVQYLVHAWLIHHLSLVVLPTLYMLFGVVLDMLMMVALYAWAMSWPCSAADRRQSAA